MKNYRKQFYILLTFTIFSFTLPLISKAQGPAPGNDVDAPIDGGVSLLVAAGIGYGIKKVKDNRKKKSIEIM